MARHLASAARHRRKRAELAAEGVVEVRRAASQGLRRAGAMLSLYQLEIIRDTLAATEDHLTEQDISAEQVGSVNAEALATEPLAAATLMSRVASLGALTRFASTMLHDASRTATQVDIVTRPAVTGHVRDVSVPCCSRCALLAGRVYRWSSGFRRHPQCECGMIPTDSSGAELVTTPDELFRRGQIRDLSRADTRAVREGADLGRVVNVQKKAAGLSEGSSVIARGNKLTPAGIYRVASDKDEALRLMRRYGYVL